MVDKAAVALGLAVVQRPLEGIEDEIGMHGAAYPPTHDTLGENVDGERHVQPTLPARDVREIRHQELIGRLRLELPIHTNEWIRCFRIADRRSAYISELHASKAAAAHKAFEGAAGYHMAFSAQLPPDLLGAVDLRVLLPDAVDMRQQQSVSFPAHTATSPPASSAQCARYRGHLRHDTGFERPRRFDPTNDVLRWARPGRRSHRPTSRKVVS